MRIIPAIDIIDGKCVRLSKGDYNTKIIYNENPLEVAKRFARNKYLVVEV
jgi:phosphoribosylformimino-5-aminoimidazole carboxamide ribotide isomerase